MTMKITPLLLFAVILQSTTANIDECAEGTDNCDVNAECTDTRGSFTCTCNVGFEGNGVVGNCTNVDECDRGTYDCKENTMCVDTPGSYTCDEVNSTFIYEPYQLYWNSAIFLCDCFGHLAVVDTPEKQRQLLEQVDIPDGECAWIGASNYNFPDYEFRWLKVPTSYHMPLTNGESLKTTFNNFTSGFPKQGKRPITAVCIERDGTWKAKAYNTTRSVICEFNECGPGKYKGKLNGTKSYCQFINDGRDACVPCEAGTEKLGFGNSKDLCAKQGYHDIPDGECAWIGASTWNYPDYEFRWLQLPISYHTSRTNGERLNSTFNNFTSGFPEDEPKYVYLTAACIKQDGTWMATAQNTYKSMICEFIECGLGKYKGKIPATNNYCQMLNGGNDACVPCEDGTEKLGFGNSKDLCVQIAK